MWRRKATQPGRFLGKHWKWIVGASSPVLLLLLVTLPRSEEDIATSRCDNIERITPLSQLDEPTAWMLLQSCYAEDTPEFLAGVEDALNRMGLISGDLPTGVEQVVRGFSEAMVSADSTLKSLDVDSLRSAISPLTDRNDSIWQAQIQRHRLTLDSAYLAGGIDSLLRALPAELRQPFRRFWWVPTEMDAYVVAMRALQSSSGPPGLSIDPIFPYASQLSALVNAQRRSEND